MLQKIVVHCKTPGESNANYNWGSLFHGYLMSQLPAETAEALHEINFRPYSQFVFADRDGNLDWNLGIWSNEIATDFISAIMPVSVIELKHKEMVLNVAGVERNTTNKTEYFKHFFTSETPCRRYEIEFITPCTHKQAGKYVLFPSTELIVQNLAIRFSAFSQNMSLDDPEAVQQVARHMQIVRYSLRTALFSLENTKINGYIGRITIVINGPEQLARLAGALLSFAAYSGIGIKTALGMGGVRVREII